MSERDKRSLGFTQSPPSGHEPGVTYFMLAACAFGRPGAWEERSFENPSADRPDVFTAGNRRIPASGRELRPEFAPAGLLR
jgi:hypothetical protein